MPTKYQSLKPDDKEERMHDISKIFHQTQKFRVLSLLPVWVLTIINYFVSYNVRLIVFGITSIVLLFITVDTLLIKKKLSKTTKNICFGDINKTGNKKVDQLINNELKKTNIHIRRSLRKQSLLILSACIGLFLLLYWHSINPIWWKSIITIIFSLIYTILVQNLFLKTIQEVAGVQIDEKDFKK